MKTYLVKSENKIKIKKRKKQHNKNMGKKLETFACAGSRWLETVFPSFYGQEKLFPAALDHLTTLTTDLFTRKWNHSFCKHTPQ